MSLQKVFCVKNVSGSESFVGIYKWSCVNYECINLAWFLVKLLEKYFLYIEVCTLLDFSILSVIIK